MRSAYPNLPRAGGESVSELVGAVLSSTRSGGRADSAAHVRRSRRRLRPTHLRSAMPLKHLEDFAVGEVIDCGSTRPTLEEIVAFAREFDPQPFHVDEAAARESPYGGIIASGWHTCSLFMRLMVDALLSRTAGLGSPGVDQLRWLRPVRPGDELRGRLTVLEVKPSGSKPDRGAVKTRGEMLDAEGRPVMTMESWMLVRRRGQ
jgi:acyl dehydratase